MPKVELNREERKLRPVKGKKQEPDDERDWAQEFALLFQALEGVLKGLRKAGT